MISTIAIINMSISLLVCILVTFGLYFYLRKKLDLKPYPLLIGAAVFILFVSVLESMLHSLVLRPAEGGGIALMQEAPILYILYGAFAAGIFEETGRLCGFWLLRRKNYTKFGTAISYGIGHGGVEVVLLVMTAMVSNLVFCIMVNGGAIDITQDAAMASAVQTLAGTPAWLFLMAGFERICAMALHIALSVLVWHAVSSKASFWLYPVSIVLHAVVDIPAAAMQCGLLTNALVVEGLVALSVALVIAFTVWTHRRLTTAETTA